MARMEHDAKDNGVWRGRTEASIEGLARSLDILRETIDKSLDRLPCDTHRTLIDQNLLQIISLRTRVLIYMGLVSLVVAPAVATVVTLAIKKFFGG